jgi:hypothetical protein
MPQDCDLVQLIYACEDFEPAEPGFVRFRMERSMPVASGGYLIRRSGAVKMLESAYPIRYPADSLLGRSYRWGVNILGASPRLIEINNIFPSNILIERSFKQRATTLVRRVLLRLIG